MLRWNVSRQTPRAGEPTASMHLHGLVDGVDEAGPCGRGVQRDARPASRRSRRPDANLGKPTHRSCLARPVQARGPGQRGRTSGRRHGGADPSGDVDARPQVRLCRGDRGRVVGREVPIGRHHRTGRGTQTERRQHVGGARRVPVAHLLDGQLDQVEAPAGDAAGEFDEVIVVERRRPQPGAHAECRHGATAGRWPLSGGIALSIDPGDRHGLGALPDQ